MDKLVRSQFQLRSSPIKLFTIAALGFIILGCLLSSLQQAGMYALKVYERPYSISDATHRIKEKISQSHLSLHRHFEKGLLGLEQESSPLLNELLQTKQSVKSEFSVIQEEVALDRALVQKTIDDTSRFFELASDYASLERGLGESAGLEDRNIALSANNAYQSLDAILSIVVNDAYIFKKRLESEFRQFIVLLGLLFLYLMFLLYWFHRSKMGKLKAISNEHSSASDWGTLILNASPDPTIVFDQDGKVSSANEQASIFFGYGADEICTLCIEDFVPEIYRSEHKEHHRRFSDDPLVKNLRKNSGLKAVGKNGVETDVSIKLTPVKTDEQEFVIASVRDISKEKQILDLVSYQANYDQLTGLPNRTMVKDRFKLLTAQCERSGISLAFVFIDLDNFKNINDTLGHEVGDEVLRTVSNRLKNNIRGCDTVARFGGDEFVMLLQGVSDVGFLERILDPLVAEFDVPVAAAGKKFKINVSMGVTFYPVDGTQFSELSRKADAALYHAKALGGGQYCRYFDTLTLNITRRFSIEEAFAVADFERDFFVVYQPQIDIVTGKVIGAESLVRWGAPAAIKYHPNDFIAVAERSGYITELGRFVLSRSIEFAAKLVKGGHEDFQISVNVSPKQFHDPQCVDFIFELLDKSGLLPANLLLELTEGILLDNSEEVLESLRRLNEGGVNLSMDDFGTGYSSLSYLRKFHFKHIKIDKCFVDDIGISKDSEIIIRSSIAMAHTMNISVVAEGIENKEQEDFLVNARCDLVQGYLYSKPIVDSDFMTFIDTTGAAPVIDINSGKTLD